MTLLGHQTDQGNIGSQTSNDLLPEGMKPTICALLAAAALLDLDDPLPLLLRPLFVGVDGGVGWRKCQTLRSYGIQSIPEGASCLFSIKTLNWWPDWGELEQRNCCRANLPFDVLANPKCVLFVAQFDGKEQWREQLNWPADLANLSKKNGFCAGK